MLEYLRWPRKIWYSGGGIVGMVFGRNFTETNASWVGERGLIAQMGKIWDKLERIGWRSELLGEWMAEETLKFVFFIIWSLFLFSLLFSFVRLESKQRRRWLINFKLVVENRWYLYGWFGLKFFLTSFFNIKLISCFEEIFVTIFRT